MNMTECEDCGEMFDADDDDAGAVITPARIYCENPQPEETAYYCPSCYRPHDPEYIDYCRENADEARAESDREGEDW